MGIFGMAAGREQILHDGEQNSYSNALFGLEKEKKSRK